jgi:lysozyme
LAVFERAVASAVKTELTEDQFSALVSFTFNVGAGAFRDSTLLRKLNAGRLGEGRRMSFCDGSMRGATCWPGCNGGAKLNAPYF